MMYSPRHTNNTEYYSKHHVYFSVPFSSLPVKAILFASAAEDLLNVRSFQSAVNFYFNRKITDGNNSPKTNYTCREGIYF